MTVLVGVAQVAVDLTIRPFSTKLLQIRKYKKERIVIMDQRTDVYRYLWLSVTKISITFRYKFKRPNGLLKSPQDYIKSKKKKYDVSKNLTFVVQ